MSSGTITIDRHLVGFRALDSGRTETGAARETKEGGGGGKR